MTFFFLIFLSSQKNHRYSRLYLNFKSPEDVVEFAEVFNGHVLVNEKGIFFILLYFVHDSLYSGCAPYTHWIWSYYANLICCKHWIKFFNIKNYAFISDISISFVHNSCDLSLAWLHDLSCYYVASQIDVKFWCWSIYIAIKLNVRPTDLV